MFPRVQRLRRSSDVVAALRKGRRFSYGPITCHFQARPDREGRVTVVVDTKASKKAVVRNLLKRRARAILQTTPLPKGDLVVRVYAPALVLSHLDLQNCLQQCLKKLS